MSYKDKIDPNDPLSDRAMMLLEKWDKSVFRKILELENEVNQEHIYHQRKFDISCKLPNTAWGRSGLVKATNEAMGIYDYCFLLIQADRALDQMKTRIKRLYFLLGFNEELGER